MPLTNTDEAVSQDLRDRIAGLHFLIAEADAFQRRWLALMLTRLGARAVIETANGRDALAVLRDAAQPVDIAIVDLHLPDFDTAELVRQLAGGQRCAIVFSSALGSAPPLPAAAQGHGLNLLGSFEKPPTAEVLRGLIDNYRPTQTSHADARGAAPSFSLDDIAEGIRLDQFEPFFQPKVELADGSVAAVEAFVRWRHPRHGLVPPSAFIPKLEAGGLMESLTWSVIDKSVRACRAWHERGLMLSVSINLSATSLAQPGLAEKILAHIAEQRIEPQYLTFEISELIAMTEVPVCLENLARLRMKGFGLSVDDYGTAHSNMQQLLRIPFLDLKIDRSFVAGAAHNRQLALALGASLELARKLHRHSVAVGVETREDWDLLHDLGCTYAQGHYIARPMERDAIPGWVAQWSLNFSKACKATT